jgi:L-asparagine transporter-like permease
VAAVLREAGAGLGADKLKPAALRFRSSSEEVRLNWNTWVRQFHRWLSIAFTVAVIANIVALVQKEQAVWVGLLALLPLALLLFTGLYLFALPYASKWRSGRGAAG